MFDSPSLGSGAVGHNVNIEDCFHSVMMQNSAPAVCSWRDGGAFRKQRPVEKQMEFQVVTERKRDTHQYLKVYTKYQKSFYSTSCAQVNQRASSSLRK